MIPLKKANSRGTQKAQLQWWKKQIGAHLLGNVTPAILAECRDRLAFIDGERKVARSPSTVVRYLAVLSHDPTTRRTPMPAIHGNIVVHVENGNQLVGRRLHNGREEWAFALQGQIVASRAVAQQVAVIGTKAGFLYLFARCNGSPKF